MRKTYFIGSWKSYKTKSEAEAYFKELPTAAAGFKHEVVLCPATCHLDMAQRMLPVTVKLGSQNVSQHGSGPFTGEISASILKSYGVQYCLVGHVERRIAGETDAQINNKVKKCIEAGITPVLIVGESLADHDNNQTRVVLEKQLTESMMGVKEHDKVIVCYMPGWTIGTGHYASGDYANIIIEWLRKVMQKITRVPMAGNIPMLYGGQVTQSNAAEYLEKPEIDGVVFAVAAMSVQSLVNLVSVPFKH